MGAHAGSHFYFVSLSTNPGVLSQSDCFPTAIPHDGALMNNGRCEVRRVLREAVTVRARTLLEARARLSKASVAQERLAPLGMRGELADAISAYRRALTEFESHVGTHRCE